MIHFTVDRVCFTENKKFISVGNANTEFLKFIRMVVGLQGDEYIRKGVVCETHSWGPYHDEKELRPATELQKEVYIIYSYWRYKAIFAGSDWLEVETLFWQGDRYSLSVMGMKSLWRRFLRSNRSVSLALQEAVQNFRDEEENNQTFSTI